MPNHETVTTSSPQRPPLPFTTLPGPATVAELKRVLVPGTEYIVKQTFKGPCDPTDPVNRREVLKSTTVGTQSALPIGHPQVGEVSHLAWPKASHYEPTETGFRVLMDPNQPGVGWFEAILIAE